MPLTSEARSRRLPGRGLRWPGHRGPAAAAEADNLLTAAIGRLFAVAEAYPDLKANENFLQLQNELAATEDKIAAARRYYNATVLRFNNAIQTFPAVLLAGAFRLRQARVLRRRDSRSRASGGQLPVVTLQQQIRANRFRTALVLAAFALLIAAIAGSVYALYDVGVGVLVLGIGAAYGIYAYISSGKMVARLTGARTRHA